MVSEPAGSDASTSWIRATRNPSSASIGCPLFTLWGTGCAICSDRYKAVMYLPQGAHGGPGAQWTPGEAKSLADKDLPHSGRSIVDGLYIVPLEPEWYLFRFEYSE